MRGIVVHRADNYASRALHHLVRRFAPRIGKPAHFSSVSASEPFGNAREFRPNVVCARQARGIIGARQARVDIRIRGDRCNAAKIEAKRAGLRSNPRSAFGGVHGGNCYTVFACGRANLRWAWRLIDCWLPESSGLRTAPSYTNSLRRRVTPKCDTLDATETDSRTGLMRSCAPSEKIPLRYIWASLLAPAACDC